MSKFLMKSGWAVPSKIDDQRPAAVPEIIASVRQHGGLLGAWRMQRAFNRQGAALAEQTLQAHFDAKREELIYRIALNLDEAKKRAIAQNMADTADIEREIAQMTTSIMVEIDEIVATSQRQIMLVEVEQQRTLEDDFKREAISEKRYRSAVARIEVRVNELLDRVEVTAQRVVFNLGERLDEALRIGRSENRARRP